VPVQFTEKGEHGPQQRRGILFLPKESGIGTTILICWLRGAREGMLNRISQQGKTDGGGGKLRKIQLIWRKRETVPMENGSKHKTVGCPDWAREI